MIDPRFYNFNGAATARSLAAAVGLSVTRGDPDRLVSSVGGAALSGPDDLTFLEDGGAATAPTLKAGGVCFASASQVDRWNFPDTVAIAASSPRGAFARAASLLVVPREIEPGQPHIHPSAKLGEGCVLAPGCVIGANVAIGAGVRIGANAVIGPGVQIGVRSIVGPNAAIRCALIGDDVAILAGAVIGEAGFGLAAGATGAILTPHFGRVIIQNYASVGANSCVDRGLFTDTVLGEHVHIDNLCQVAHNACVGSHTAMAAFAGVSGSVEIGEGVLFGGRVGLADHIKIGDRAQVAAGSGVFRDVPAGQTYSGYPAKPLKTWVRELGWLSRESQKRSAKAKE